MKTPKILLPALRQFQHNNCSGFVKGFDHDETIKIFNKLFSSKDYDQIDCVKSNLLKALDIIEKL